MTFFSTFQSIVQLSKSFWTGPKRKLAWMLTIGAFTLALVDVGMQVALNAWNKGFYDAIEKKSLDGLTTSALLFLGLIVASTTNVVLSQLSRAPENRDKEGTPRISDLRDSGAIEQDADVVMLLWRPAYYANKFTKDNGDGGIEDNLAKVDIGKNRNGAVGVADLTFESEFTQFSDRDTSHGEG